MMHGARVAIVLHRPLGWVLPGPPGASGYGVLRDFSLCKYS